MAFTQIFERQEYKYIMTKKQKERMLAVLREHGMEIDSYGRTTIRNIYFDTDSYRLIRRSIESPVYKEKLRVRSYELSDDDSTVFVELKKKYDHIVYKRRIPLKTSEAEGWLWDRQSRPADTQIAREIDYFLSFYKTLRPTLFLSYEREAFFKGDGEDLRVTFDENILSRQDDLSLKIEAAGEFVLPEELTLMEIKCGGAIPKWLAKALSNNGLYKTSFSKYGNAYVNSIYPKLKEEIQYA
ncbi:MAG: polyphosphate polymerase domain-containing protein [Clostridia bacterium]|nr:polyphosphate polymerase domain-containing protein [Clostridia bacterium]